MHVYSYGELGLSSYIEKTHIRELDTEFYTVAQCGNKIWLWSRIEEDIAPWLCTGTDTTPP